MNIADDNSPSGLDAHFTWRRFAMFLALTIFAAFPKVIIGSETFFYRDYLNVVYPYAQYNHDCFWRGELPLWNPLNHCGVPYLAQWQTFVLYPGWWICMPFPPSWSLGIFTLGHLFFAGLAMYFLAHRWSGSRVGACVAGIIYVWNGLMQNSLTWPHIVAALAWAPVVIIAVERALHGDRKHLLLAALAGTMQMLTGAPEQILFTWLVIAGVVCIHAIRARSSWWKMTIRVAVIIVLVALMASAQLLPFLELMAQSQRHADFAGTQGAMPGGMSWAMPSWGFANFFVPYFYNFQTPSGVYFQSGQYLTSSYYLGIGTIALVLLALLRKRSGLVFLLATMTVAALLLALGNHTFVYPAVKSVFPWIGFMRYPVKFLFLAILLVPILCAVAIAHLQSVDLRRRRSEWVSLGAIGATCLTAIAAVVWFAYQYPLYPGMANYWPLVLQSGYTRAAFLVVIVAALVCAQLLSRSSIRIVMATVAVIAVWLDLYTHTSPTPNPTAPRWAYERGIVKMEPMPRLGEARAFVTLKTQMDFMGYQATDAAKDVIYNRLVLLHQCNLMDGIPVVGGAHTLLLPHSDAVTTLLLSTNRPLPGALADFLGVSQLTQSGTLDWQPRPGALPLVTAGQSPVFADEATVFRSLAASSFDPRTMVYLPMTARENIQVTNATTPQIISTNITSHKIDLEVASETGTWVVIAQSYHRNWRPTVDGQPATLWKANYGFQAVEIPAGKRRLTLTYRDDKFIAGSILSIVTFLTCVASLVVARCNPR